VPGGPPGSALCPVVGIGCSAGGLEALEKFFSQTPVDSGAAFVIVQHLSPAHTSALPDLLAQFTRMPVAEVKDGMAVQPDHVYVIPPGSDLALLHGTLRLLKPAEKHGLRLPIDFFLRTLADDRRERAIGVVLSGMGSDGALGLAAIREKGGLTLVQDPATAQADGMPASAVRAGAADIVAHAEALPARIASHLQHPLLRDPARPEDTPELAGALERIGILLRASHGTDFTQYKTNSLCRRIGRRMVVRQVADIDEYARLLQSEAHEVELLFKELLIGVTSFFRDPAVWDALRDTALPALFAQHPEGRAVRAWVPACSTGEEAYSLAIVFAEALDRLKPVAPFTLQVFATDLDETAIAAARRGVYPQSIAADVSPERLARCFGADEGGWRVNKNIRDTVVFATQDITADPPFTKLDILSCRNLLIYFRTSLQQKMLPLFHYALNPGGLLVLGSAETVGNFGQHFATLDQRCRIYRRSPQAMSTSEVQFTMPTPSATPPLPAPQTHDAAEHIGQLTDQLIQQTWAPAAVLVNADGDILYVSGRTGKYLEPAAGKTNINVHAMAREGLREALVGVIRKALNEQRPVVLPALRVGTNGGTQRVDVTVQALGKPELLRGLVIIVFKDVPDPPARSRRRKSDTAESQSAMSRELQQCREALQEAHLEMQTLVEELKSGNEELQSTNEELQSTNEELTTSKEELQSLNEELQTVNAELESKVEDLTSIRNDMSNLLNSTEIATVFLDGAMNLRRYTTHATKIFRLIQGDVGRPLGHVVSDLEHPNLVLDAQEVLRTLVFRETVAPTGDGRWYRVRTMPYRTQENVIDGVVITFTDITEIKLLEAELRKPRT
jgi:chemotaxis methyl-accepting protein methylase